MSLSVQFYTMLAMIAMGSFFGASLDTYQRFLKRRTRSRMIVFLNDILFWIFHGLITFYVLFLVNYGEIRFYLLLALLCGFAAYQALMKRLYNQLLELIISFFKATATFLKRLFIILLFNPVKGLLLFLYKILLYLLKLLFLLVKAIGKVILWAMRILFFPVSLLGKGILSILPQSFKNKMGKIFNKLAGFYKKVKKIVKRAYLFIKKLFSK